MLAGTLTGIFDGVRETETGSRSDKLPNFNWFQNVVPIKNERKIYT